MPKPMVVFCVHFGWGSPGSPICPPLCPPPPFFFKDSVTTLLLTLKSSDYFDGDPDAIFRVNLIVTEKDKTQKDASFKAKWENVYNEIIYWKEV